MNDVYAWVVGIDHYDQNDWSLVGPCANALAVVEWLLTVNVPAANVRLFLDSEDPAIDDAAGKLAQRGVSVGRRADHATIDTFWRRDLRQSPKNFSRLFVYWSGHGFADNEGDRVFVCRDYLHPDLDNRVFNSANVLRHLRGSAYQHLREQIFIADVCATHANVALSPDKKPPADFVKATHQGAFFATPEGEYAKGANGRGAFTETVLEVLAKLNAWPEQTQLDADLKIAFEAIDKAIFHVSTFLDEAHETRRVGRLSAAPGTVFRSIFDALTGVNVADEVYRRHFLRTVNDLGEPALAAAQGLTGMLRELASLRDADEGEAPHGLLQFLVRLQQEAALTDVVEQWLAANAQRQQNALATVRAKLVAEAATKILIVEVANDQREEVSGYELSVRTNTLVPLPGISFPRRSLNGWSEFEAALVADLETLRRDHGVADFEIQFLVNPPLFDRSFHMLKKASGMPLGEEHVVVLRHLERVRTASTVFRETWYRYAKELQTVRPSELKLLAISSAATPPQIGPIPRGLCYTDFLVDAAAGTGPRATAAKQTLLKLLRSGAPYVYWLHRLPVPNGFAQIQGLFAGWLGQVSSLGDVPNLIARERLQGNDFANHATILWDDPEFNPFPR